MKIIIADDHALFRDGLRHVLGMLGADVEIIEAADHTALMMCADQHANVDLVLMDLSMPGAEPFDSLRAVLSRYPTLLVVVLSASEETSHMRRALDAGAMGYIPKRESSSILLSALRLVLAGGIYVPSSMMRDYQPDYSTPRTETRSTLTPRQLDVLRELVNGKANKEIAQKLDMSEATVKVHITAIFRNLNVSNRTQAALAAEKLGLLAP
ncbi:MAG TPA: response regulator transcription factor [Gammaproteobacteria bacterium]|nr:response regulator transcription factor [Gammaproteobacteria bacterium]